MSSVPVDELILILVDSLTTSWPRYHVTSGSGFDLQRHFIVISVPASFGIMRGFSTNDGAKPFGSSPPLDYRHQIIDEKNDNNNNEKGKWNITKAVCVEMLNVLQVAFDFVFFSFVFFPQERRISKTQKIGVNTFKPHANAFNCFLFLFIAHFCEMWLDT